MKKFIFMGITKKKVGKSKRKYIFKIHVYFTEYFLVVEIDEKTTKAEILFLKKKKKGKRHQKKKLDCIFIRINTSDAKRGYDTDYEVSKIQIFISKFKEKRIK